MHIHQTSFSTATPLARLASIGVGAGLAAAAIAGCASDSSRSTDPVTSTSEAQTVGGVSAGDYSAQLKSGTISTAVGSFPSVTVTGETDVIADNFSLQLNSNLFSTPLCSPKGVPIPGCLGWQQFVYGPVGKTVNGTNVEVGRIYMEYWLLGYGDCTQLPPGWQGSGNCFVDSPKTTVPAQAITNLANLQLTATAGVLDTLTLSIAGDPKSPYSMPPQPSMLGLARGWNTAEFNVFGNLDQSNAHFDPGTTIVVQILTTSATPTTAAPVCDTQSFTAETNDLTLVPGSCTAFGGASPGIQFTETNLPAPAAPGCTWTYNCQPEPLPGAPIGTFQQVESVITQCAIDSTTTVQEVVSGTVSQLNPVVLGTNQEAYWIGSQSEQGTVTAGLPLGTVAGVQACAHANGFTTCDDPTNITIASCCTPKTCETGMCGSQSDGCGGTITCPACPVCVPTQTCASLKATCGTFDDCGNPLDCGTCPGGEACVRGSCVSCVPKSQTTACLTSCGDDEPDGCGGTVQCPTLTGATCCHHLHGTWNPKPPPGSCSLQ